MKVIEKADATASLAEYADAIQSGPVVVTSGGQPMAALAPIKNADLETVGLATDRQFIELIEHSRARALSEGGISSEEMRQRLG
jgi:antitoxin (DNA-binding transcriptional repressor) of toxin-antitoxin stability system